MERVPAPSRGMGWLLPAMAPAPRQMPGALLKAAILGVLVSLPLSFVFTSPDQWRYFWRDPLAWTLRAAAIGATFSVTFYAACGLPVSYVLSHVLPQKGRHQQAIVWLTGALGGALGCITALLVFAVAGGSVTPDLLKLAVVDGILAVVLSVVISSWYGLRTQKELADARARHQLLQSQINPHFFFNTLNTIASLIRSDPAAAEHTVGLLADMSRYAFTTTRTEVVPLMDELEFVQSYVEIEKARFGERLRSEMPSPRDVEGLSLPALMIQPLVENGIRHGIARRLGGGTVRMSVRREEAHFVVTVQNETEDTPTDFFSPGHALANIRERLSLAYGDRASIQASVPELGVVAISIRAPYSP